MHVAAVRLANDGRLGAAKNLLESAAALDADVDLRARIAGTLALIHARTGGLAEAERMCTEAMDLPGLSPTTVAILAGQMGSIMEESGRLDEANRLLSRAIAQIEDPVARANLLVNRTAIGAQQRRLDDAANDAAEAARVYAENGMPIDAAESQHNLGYIDLLRGDLVSALAEMQSARPLLEDVPFAAMMDVDRADVLRNAGLTTQAEEILTQAVAALGRRRMPRARAEAEYNLARSVIARDPARAAAIAGAAARRFRALGNDTLALRADALRMQALLASNASAPVGGPGRRPRRSPGLEEIEDVASTLDRHGFRNEAASLRMARELELARRGDDGAARPVRVPRAASMEVRLLAHEVRAARAESAGRAAEARRHAAAGLDVLGGWQRTFGSLDLQTSFVMHGRGLMLSGLRAAVRSGRPDVVFDWSERVRQINQQVQPLRPPPDQSVADQLAELRMLRADDPDGAWLHSPRASELQHQMRERQWSGTGSGGLQQRASLPDLVEALGEDTALLSFVYTQEAMLALVVAGQRATLIDLPGWPAARAAMRGLRADLDMAASVRTGPMAGVVRAALADRLATLSDLLIGPALSVVGDRRLVITTPGIMAGIPWAMLPTLRGRVFTLAVSASRWTRFRSVPRRWASAGFAAGPRVQRGQEEVETAAKSWTSATVIQGAGATVGGVAELAAEVDVLHVAAHGRHAIDNPLFSGLELVDGALFGYDIDLIPQVPDTVVLSACEGGRSSVRWGEEAVGMTRVWLHAGTRCVIAASVMVADDEACELLGAMHEGLASGQAPAEALAAASAHTGIVAPFQSHGAGF